MQKNYNKVKMDLFNVKNFFQNCIIMKKNF